MFSYGNIESESMLLNANLFCKGKLPAVSLILLAGIIVYANSFQVPFALDDYLWIHQNEVIKDLSNFFTNSTGYESSRARFIAGLTLALNYHFGGLNVIGYHVVNLLIHLLAALLVYALMRLTFRTPYFQVKTQGLGGREACAQPSAFIPLFAALLFIVHPVQTEAVTYIVQRMTSLVTLFYLLSLVLYVEARIAVENSEFRIQNSGGKTYATDFRRLVKPAVLIVGSVLAAVLAMKTKEIAFTLPLAVGLYEVFFFKGPWTRRLLFLLPILATLPIVPMTTLAADGFTGAALADVDEQLRAHTDMSRLSYIFTQFRVIVTYLRLLVLPVNQNLDYDYPVYTTFFTPPVFLSFLLLAAIFALAVYLLFVSRLTPHASRRRVDPDVRLISFGVFWFFLALSVESSFIPIVDVIFEHRLYLPSIGAAIAFSAGFSMLQKKFSRIIAYLSILAGSIIIISLSIATHQRNIVWGSAIGLWEDVVSKSPQKVRPASNLGQALVEADRPWDAIPVLSRAVDMAPYYHNANFNLGRAYTLIGQSRTAIPFLQKAIAYKPEFDLAYIALGAALIKDERYNEAVTLLAQNLDRLGNRPEVRFNLGVAYVYSGNQAAARQQLDILYRQEPGLASKLATLLR
jgi:tetratricopeptide (TPR) repeat protein